MDLDRTTTGQRATDLRGPKAQQERGAKGGPAQIDPTAAEAARSEAPLHGGPEASDRVAAHTAADRQETSEPDAAVARYRQEAQETLRRFLSIPGSTVIDIQVDVQHEQVVFQVRDRDTGELIRQIPEDDAGGLFERLREFHGALLDREF